MKQLDHSGIWGLASALYTFEALKDYYKLLPGCNKRNCYSYRECEKFFVYFDKKELINSQVEGFLFYASNENVAIFIDAVKTFINELKVKANDYDKYRKRTHIDYLLAYEDYCFLIRKLLAFYQASNTSFTKKAWDKVEYYCKKHFCGEELLQCLLVNDMAGSDYFNEIGNWVKILVKHYTQNECTKKDINQHAKDFGHMFMSFDMYEGADEDYFYEKLKKYDNNKLRQIEIQYNLLVHKSQKSILWSGLVKELFSVPDDVFYIARNLSIMSLYRLKLREAAQRLSYVFEKNIMPYIYNSIDNQHGKEYFMYLTSEEIIKICNNTLALSTIAIKKRKEVYIELNASDISLLFGKKAIERIENIKSDIDGVKNTHAFNGIIVYGKNKLKGIVVKIDNSTNILNDNFDFHSVKNKIIVTPSLRPNISNICMNAKCVLTEEGGITSHASVVCKELRIPCIVGVSNIYDSFSDGDYIEVDFNKNKIRKIDENSEGNEKHVDVPIIPINHEFYSENLLSHVGGKANTLFKIDVSKIPQAFVITAEGIQDIENIAKDIKTHISKLGCKKLAIRSSFIEEDSHEKSYAGIFKSYTNIDSDDYETISLRINDVIHSAESEIAKNYTGGKTSGKLGVIIQKNIKPKISGVFITSVVRQGYDYCMVEYAPGDLSCIMDGLINPLRTYAKKIDIEKDEFKEIPPFLFFEQKKYFEELLKLGMHYENEWGYPLEIEWGIDDSQLWIFQARPLTVRY